MARWRLGVALLVPEPFASEINGLRRALNDGGRERMAPHITLVPPVNVRVDALGDAVTVLRNAAQTVEPFDVELGPVESFLPESPTLKLGVSGPGEQTVRVLRDTVFRAPLERALTFPFSPHVTVADEIDDSRSAAALRALRDYCVTVTFDRVWIMREGEKRVWQPVADAPFAPDTVVGRGGLEISLSRTHHLDPAAQLGLELDEAPTSVCFTARMNDEVVGAVSILVDGAEARIQHLAVGVGNRGLGIGSHLLRALTHDARESGIRYVVNANAGLDEYLTHRGFSAGRLLIL